MTSRFITSSYRPHFHEKDQRGGWVFRVCAGQTDCVMACLDMAVHFLTSWYAYKEIPCDIGADGLYLGLHPRRRMLFW